MDKINTDDLLVKILSFLPTKVAVTTSILSKRWKFLWMRVPKLEYDDSETKRLRRLRSFIKRNLPLHSFPVLESLRLKFTTLPFQPEDIEQWVEVAVSLCVRELSIEYFSHYKAATLPDCLYTCKSLETLKLDDEVFVVVPNKVCLPSLKNLQLGGVRYCLDEDVQLLDVSHTVCFPSLKSLHLKEVIFFDKRSLRLLLANCPDLEELVLKLDEYDNMGLEAVPIILQSLKSLSISLDHIEDFPPYVVEIVAPSLKYIKLVDHCCNNSFLIKNMPKLEEAYVYANIFECEKFLGSFTSVKRLNLCLMLQPTEARNVDAICFNQLESLKICVCKPYWSVLLVRLLKGSPKLKALELYSHTFPLCFNSPLICWDQVTPVPECLLTSLETFKWTDLPQRQEAKDMIAYITKNSRRLKSEPFPGTWSPGSMTHARIIGNNVFLI
ncbi:PREDICTED: putative FBD-associated F-box protein At5g56410 [Camelina sativa]|uniref:FBD-associated F-box protein At5g56410 n=1 Tax=Camelina sativa TaxID=90675 RepID=A0ABM1QVL9_CAMSA|nr:PREDICTED: putative FBD-associated F-box protein At5g56410 [Camelina sativa]